jgi:hypothetical protein
VRRRERRIARDRLPVILKALEDRVASPEIEEMTRAQIQPVRLGMHRPTVGEDWLLRTWDADPNRPPRSHYLIDYGAKRIVIGPPGTLPRVTGGHRKALTWIAGRPAVTATVRGPTLEPFTVRLVLDSGADHVTLFGLAAQRLALVADPDRTIVIDSGFGTREVPITMAGVNADGRNRSVSVGLRRDVGNREEDGLLPTSFYRSVLVSTADGVVIFNARVAPTHAPKLQSCDVTDARRPR